MINLPKKYSPSSINQFRKCSYQWKLRNIDGLEGLFVENKKAELGTYLHQTIKEYYNSIPNEPRKDTIKTFASTIFERNYPASLKELRPHAEEMLNNFIKFDINRVLNKQPKPVFTEQTLEDDNFKGIIDFFDGKRIIDWKFGVLLSLTDDYLIQGKIYDLLIRHNYPQYTYTEVYFFAGATGRLIRMPTTTEAWLMEQVKTMYNNIERGNFTKNKTPLCNWCPVQLACEMDPMTLWSGIPLCP